MKRAALYARTSTELQKDEQTVKVQLAEIETAIKKEALIYLTNPLQR